MRILIACEESQAVCIAFRQKGHEAYSIPTMYIDDKRRCRENESKGRNSP